MHDFWRKIFLMLYSVNWPSSIVWLPLHLKILGNMFIIIAYKSTLSFWPSRFSTWPKSQDKDFNILKTKRTFKIKRKAFFIIFKGLLVAKNRLRLESAPLSDIRSIVTYQRAQMFPRGDSSNRQKMNSCCSFQWVLQQNLSWFFS